VIMRVINRVAVIGGGSLGREIAIHLANCGVRTFLDPDNPEITSNNLRESASEFYLPESAENITIGNFTADPAAIGDCDWIIETTADKLEVKREILSRIDSARKSDSVVSTSTVGFKVDALCEGLSDGMRLRFFGAHFLSPVRQKKLVEIVPTQQTADQTTKLITDFCQDVLGKGVVIAKDVPGFIAERVFGFADSSSFSALEAVDIRDVVYRGDETSESMWRHLSETILNTANVVEEIADDITRVDDALRWGKDWTLGPFQLWDAVGVERAANRLLNEGRTIPSIVEKLLGSGAKTFYRRAVGKEYFFDFSAGEHKPVTQRPGVTNLRHVQAVNGVVSKNPHATILDFGDGVGCLEFHSNNNVVSNDTILMLNYVIDLLDNGEFDALVIANQGRNFCGGIDHAGLLKDIENNKWDAVRKRFEDLQKLAMRIKRAVKPIVLAPFNQTTDAGCSMVLHSNHVCLAAESNIGFSEFKHGLIPTAGGTKEFYLRSLAKNPDAESSLVVVREVFEAIAEAKISRNAFEAKKRGLIPMSAKITIDRDRLIEDARQTALRLISEKPSDNSQNNPGEFVSVLGESAYLELTTGLQGVVGHDALAKRKLAFVLTGGDLKSPSKVSEQHLLDLELEALMSLCSEASFESRL